MADVKGKRRAGDGNKETERAHLVYTPQELEEARAYCQVSGIEFSRQVLKLDVGIHLTTLTKNYQRPDRRTKI